MPFAPAELVAFLDSLDQPHIVLDSRYRIVGANRAYRARFTAGGSVVGRTCHEVSHGIAVPCDRAGEACPMAAARASGRRERVLHLHHTPRGEMHVDVELVPVGGTGGETMFFVERIQPLEAQGDAQGAGLVGRSAAFQQMLGLVARVGPSRASVLLLGESGTGKELVARAIHQSSDRAAAALVVVDCASLPESLFESELFGHERGAFTGASASKPGLVEAADGGTLFLDEVGDIPLALQVKLLRLLESGTYRRVGSTQLRRADVRVVSATHRDLTAMVAQGQFRQDLYYRLSTFPIRLPPLRDRVDDIPLLAEALLARVAGRGRRWSLTAQAVDRLMRYPFPGNVRELRNVLERAALLCDDDAVDAIHVEQALAVATGAARGARGPTAGSVAAPSPGAVLRDVERAVLRERLAHHRGTRVELARELGLSERTLYRKLRALRERP